MMNLIALLAQTETAATDGPPAPPRDTHEGTYWFPENASTFANDVDGLFMLIFWVSLIFFAGIVGAMVYFVLKYRDRPGHKVEKSPSHNTALEIAWSVLPGFLLIWFFVDGANGYFKMRVIPGNAEQIQVVGSQFNWEFYYPNGDSSKELHLVQNRPVEFVMESKDVLHSFFVPAFRQKQDIVPGRYTYCWVKPTRTGTYRVYCAEYCGNDHSLMKTNVTVHATVKERDKATYYDWEGMTPLENGQRLFSMKCSGCHNPTTEAKTGPGLAEIWGKQETLANGQTALVDDNYFRRSLEDPGAEIVEGYANQMTSFKGLSDDQIRWLRVYIKSLTDGVPPEEDPEENGAEGDSSGDDAAAETPSEEPANNDNQ